VVCYEPDGRRIGTIAEIDRARQDAERQVAAEAQARQDAERQVAAEAQARQDAEERVRQLEEELRRQRGS
jgi:hypothetical protein